MKIEKDIPIPDIEYGNGLPPKSYDFLYDMNVGDSVLLDEGNIAKCRAEARRIATWARNHDMKITQRKVDDGVRIWRTK